MRGSPRALRLIAGVLAAGAIGAIALPSLARPSPRTEFERLDANCDNRLGFTEFSRPASVDMQILVGASRRSPAVGVKIRDMVLREAFDRIDTDSDGGIGFNEYRGS